MLNYLSTSSDKGIDNIIKIFAVDLPEIPSNNENMDITDDYNGVYKVIMLKNISDKVDDVSDNIGNHRTDNRRIIEH